MLIQFPRQLFAELNVQHVKERLRRPRLDAEWSAMLAEVLEEKQAGRIEGPFEAHPSWGFESVSPDPTLHALLPMPSGPAYAAFAFSVIQEGSDGRRKVRRCEDYRRSLHNSTILAFDKPPHDTVDTYLRVIRFFAAAGIPAQIWPGPHERLQAMPGQGAVTRFHAASVANRHICLATLGAALLGGPFSMAFQQMH